MGCDIHAFVEYKKGTKWYYYIELNISRNYGLFGRMAGVRAYSSDMTPISKLKGTPKNISLTLKTILKEWEGDGHSFSWFNKKEIAEAITFHAGQVFRDKDGGIPDHIPYVQWNKYIKERIKIFDNSPRYGLDEVRQQWGPLFGMTPLIFKRETESILLGIDAVRLIFWFDN